MHITVENLIEGSQPSVPEIPFLLEDDAQIMELAGLSHRPSVFSRLTWSFLGVVDGEFRHQFQFHPCA